MMLGLLLARGGVDTTVLEKHGDFLRDFRGDTVHASTLTLLDELGLGERFASLPPRWVERVSVALDSGMYDMADLTRIPGPHKHIAFVPQWDFLDILADAGRSEPHYSLIMNADVTDLITDDGRVSGVIYTREGTTHRLEAPLVVACDGRTSVVRQRAGLRPRSFGAPMDVLWFRLPRLAEDPEGGLGRLSKSLLMILIDRGDYFVRILAELWHRELSPTFGGCLAVAGRPWRDDLIVRGRSAVERGPQPPQTLVRRRSGLHR